MPGRKRTVAAGPTPVESLKHDDKRVNIPTADAREFVDANAARPVQLRYARDPSLDPQLVWKGKDEQDAKDLVVDAPPIYIQEKIDPRVLIENLRRTAEKPEDEPELALFDSFDGLQEFETVEFYQHPANWSNRMILGDSLEVMGSLAEKENLRGQVQMIYIDPPYGIKFGSNWQASTRSREVKDGKVVDTTREVEQIKAFRDTWELGIHSYLAYLRDRLIVSRDLLTESGSVYVQIGDENIHLVRSLLDEVFGSDNFVSLITVQTTTGMSSPTARTVSLATVTDYLICYARSRPSLKYRQIWKEADKKDSSGYRWILRSDGSHRGMTSDEIAGQTALPSDARIYNPDNIQSSGSAGPQPFEHLGKIYNPGVNSHWKASYPTGMNRLAWAGRIHTAKNSIRYVRMADDFGCLPG